MGRLCGPKTLWGGYEKDSTLITITILYLAGCSSMDLVLRCMAAPHPLMHGAILSISVAASLQERDQTIAPLRSCSVLSLYYI